MHYYLTTCSSYYSSISSIIIISCHVPKLSRTHSQYVTSHNRYVKLILIQSGNGDDASHDVDGDCLIHWWTLWLVTKRKKQRICVNEKPELKHKKCPISSELTWHSQITRYDTFFISIRQPCHYHSLPYLHIPLRHYKLQLPSIIPIYLLSAADVWHCMTSHVFITRFINGYDFSLHNGRTCIFILYK
jgi:hypothetical protein